MASTGNNPLDGVRHDCSRDLAVTDGQDELICLCDLDLHGRNPRVISPKRMTILDESSSANLQREGAIAAIGLLVVLSLSITLVQDWVGRSTIYAPGFEAKRLVLHESILHNRVPAGAQTWGDVGANSVNTRVAVVYVAEVARRLTGRDVNDIYRVIDSVALFASLIVLFFYLQTFVPPVYALVGVLYLGAVLPLTLQLAYFHPWDRVSLLAWTALLLLLRFGRFVAFAALLAFSITIKFDTLLLPALYWLVRVTTRNWRAVTAQTVALFALTFGIWWALLWALPGGISGWSLLSQTRINVEDFRSMLVAYPPLIGFGAPLILAAVGLRDESRFVVASAGFGLLLLTVFALLTNFREFRAELPALILILPAALGTLVRTNPHPRQKSPQLRTL